MALDFLTNERELDHIATRQAVKSLLFRGNRAKFCLSS